MRRSSTHPAFSRGSPRRRRAASLLAGLLSVAACTGSGDEGAPAAGAGGASGTGGAGQGGAPGGQGGALAGGAGGQRAGAGGSPGGSSGAGSAGAPGGTGGSLAGAGGSLAGTGGSPAGGASGVCVAPVVCSEPAQGDDPPLLFNVSFEAGPGDVVSVQGARFTAAAQVSLRVVGAMDAPVDLPVLVGSPGHVMVRLPDNLPAGLHALTVAEGGRRSAPVLIDQPRIDQIEHGELSPGAPFRLFGRHLGGPSSQVALVSPDGQRLPAPVVDGDTYVLQATAPAGLVAGTTYRVVVDRGPGCGCGEAQADDTVVGRSGGDDPFGLGAPWGADFTFASNVYDVTGDARLALHAKGDGVTDDTDALQGAIDEATKQGGVVHLPAGTYRLGGDHGLVLRSRVVLRGDGPDKTTVQYGFVPPEAHSWGLSLYDQTSPATLSGVLSMRVQNVDTSGTWGRNWNAPATWSRVFLRDVVADLGGGGPLWLGRIDRLLIAGTTVTSVQAKYASGDQGNSGTYILGGTHFWMRDSTTSWNVDAVHFDELDGAVIERSTFTRDGSKHTEDNTRGVQLNFARRIALLGNHFPVTGTDNLALNDGETILSEGGGPGRHDEDVGTVAAATATTLTDSSKAWKPLELPAAVVIVSGAGSGQWRRIVDRTATTLTLDSPWGLTPEPDAHFAVTNWGADRWLVRGNDLTGNARGIMLYASSAHHVAIVGNTLTDSSGIWLQPFQTFDDTHRTFTPLLDVVVASNLVRSTKPFTGSFIALDLAVHSDAVDNLFGTVAFGVEFRANSVLGLTPNVPTVPGYHPYAEGFTSQVFFETPSGSFDGKPPGLLGTIFQSNSAEKSDVAFAVGTGNLDAVLWNNASTDAGKVVGDDKVQGASQASVGTVVGP